MDNYHYIIAGLPELILSGENKNFSYKALRDEIYYGCSAKDRRLIDWLEFGLNESNLSSHFYLAALSHSNIYIREYFTMDLQVRNSKVEYFTKEHSGKLQQEGKKAQTICKDICPKIERDDIETLNKIFKTKDILEKEQLLDKYKWDKINDFTLFNYFDIEKILSFLSKAMLIERWERLDKERGREMFKRLVLEVKGTFKGVN